ncbi:uncharacterized protein LOC131429296 [Malaya genurostris]|uniref:uncharacterized protein LOC131429296 n=1 Tax=Malaya genurostris TaxID=325434 RepID=UPI0026F3BE45|nr:uncharacterized protein LOC131429296 [Malaya genurostris]
MFVLSNQKQTNKMNDFQNNMDFCHEILKEFLDDSELECFLLEDDIVVGSVPRSRTYIRRNFGDAHKHIMDDYFGDQPVYNEKMFLRRFRMPKEMFLRVVEALEGKNDYFRQKVDAVGKPGLTAIQKCFAAVRMLAYGIAADSLDEYTRMGDSTAMQSLKQFCQTIISVFGDYYLRLPNKNDIERLITENGKRGFPGMVGSIDCWHWDWQACPVAYKGQFSGKEGKATVVLEAIASYDTHIWHSFFGSPGSLNDINVLDRSPILNNIINEGVFNIKYELNGKMREQAYLLADGIYPDWSIFVKTISHPKTVKEKLFCKLQETCRKDIERAFGIIQKCWHILANPARLWNLNDLHSIVTACIVLHNMRIEYRAPFDQWCNEEPHVVETADVQPVHMPDVPHPFEVYCSKRLKLRDKNKCIALRQDLIDHCWQNYGHSQE